jgi:hypothetical protein
VTANPHLKGIAIAGVLAAVAVALGMFTLARQQPASSAATNAQDLITHHLPKIAKPAKTAAAARPTTAKHTPVVAPKPKPAPKPQVSPYVKAALAAELPRPVASQFGDHEVVVISVYTPDVDVDRVSMAEAQAGAGLGGAGFVAVDASKDKTTGDLTRAFGVLSAPTTLVLTRADFTKPVTTLGGFVDRETVAQAAANADPTPGASSDAQTAWAKGAEALCARAQTRFTALGTITTPAQLQQATPKFRTITSSLLSGLRKLPAPAGRAADVEQFLSFAEQDVALTLQLVEGTVKKDAAAVAMASTKEAGVGAQANTLAISLGAPTCSEPL